MRTKLNVNKQAKNTCNAKFNRSAFSKAYSNISLTYNFEGVIN